jgi:8-oxo-dGTP pyrophosphatase MutT (NUDIX family)
MPPSESQAFPPSGPPPDPFRGDPGALAAVALIRIRGTDPEYLLLRRASNPIDPWSGHFALPGGKRDPGDKDLLATCIRETLEECGVMLTPAFLIRALPVAIAGGHMGRPMGVAPFLFEIPAKPEVCLDASEIAESHWLAQSYLLDPANRVRQAMSALHPERDFPCIKVLGSAGAIWGFTYGVLEAFWESTRT